jgi:hypothetical protein
MIETRMMKTRIAVAHLRATWISVSWLSYECECLTHIFIRAAVSESEDDGRSTEDEIMSLVQRFGQDGTCYEDSRVVDILHDSHVDQDRLLKLLHRIEQDWIKDQAREPRGTKQESFSVA